MTEMYDDHNILLVEDNADDARLIRRAMIKAGIVTPVTVVRDGDIAIDYLEGRGQYADREAHPAPTVVLLDLKLPRRSGFEVLAQMRQNSELKKLVVVVLTSSRERADIDRAYALGANSYLVKPINPDELLELMKTVQGYWLSANVPPRMAG